MTDPRENWPQCWKCKKPVERIEAHSKSFGFDHVRVLTVYCHGESEQTEFDERMLLHVRNAAHIDMSGWAFKPKGDEPCCLTEGNPNQSST